MLIAVSGIQGIFELLWFQVYLIFLLEFSHLLKLLMQRARKLCLQLSGFIDDGLQLPSDSQQAEKELCTFPVSLRHNLRFPSVLLGVALTGSRSFMVT